MTFGLSILDWLGLTHMAEWWYELRSFLELSICDEYRVFKNFPRNRLIIGYCTDNTRTTYTWVKRFTNMHCSDIEAIDRDISFLRFWDKWIGNFYISLFFAKTFPHDQVSLYGHSTGAIDTLYLYFLALFRIFVIQTDQTRQTRLE